MKEVDSNQMTIDEVIAAATQNEQKTKEAQKMPKTKVITTLDQKSNIKDTLTINVNENIAQEFAEQKGVKIQYFDSWSEYGKRQNKLGVFAITGEPTCIICAYSTDEILWNLFKENATSVVDQNINNCYSYYDIWVSNSHIGLWEFDPDECHLEEDPIYCGYETTEVYIVENKKAAQGPKDPCDDCPSHTCDWGICWIADKK